MYVLEVTTDLDRTIHKVFSALDDARRNYDTCAIAMHRGKAVGRGSQRQFMEVVRLLRVETESAWEAVAMVNAGSCEILRDSEADARKSLDELIEGAIAEACSAANMH